MKPYDVLERIIYTDHGTHQGPYGVNRRFSAKLYVSTNYEIPVDKITELSAKVDIQSYINGKIRQEIAHELYGEVVNLWRRYRGRLEETSSGREFNREMKNLFIEGEDKYGSERALTGSP